MAISNVAAQRKYQEARDAISSIVSSRKASQSEKDFARRKRDKLDAQFIGQQISQLQARTEQFEAFIQEMQAVVSRLENNSLVTAVKNIRAVTDAAVELTTEE